VRFGFYLPTRGPTATRDGVLALAREDERLVTISYKAPLYDVAIRDRDGSRRSFSSSAADIASDIRSFAAIGVQELNLDFGGESIAESITRLQRFAAEVIPLVGEQPCH
jgi:hypothetical protein